MTFDLFGPGSHGTGGLKNFSWTGGLRTSLLETIVARNPIVRGHPLASPLVGDDFGAGRREHFVITGLIEVVMGIEESVDLRIRRKGFQPGKQLVAILWRAAVD